MSTKQCEEKLKDKGVRPTAARILILQDHIKNPGRTAARRLHHGYDQLHGQRDLPGMQVPGSVKCNRVAKISSVLCIGIIKTD